MESLKQKTALNRYEMARKDRQYALLSQSEYAQQDRIAKHYVAFAHLAMQLMELIEMRRHSPSVQLDDTIKYLTKKIREGHLMEFGIELEWPSFNPQRE